MIACGLLTLRLNKGLDLRLPEVQLELWNMFWKTWNARAASEASGFSLDTR